MKKIIFKASTILIIIILLYSIYYQNGIEKFMIFAFSLLVHELSHILTSKMLGVKIIGFSINGFGARLSYERPNISPFKEMFIYLSGPISNLLFAFIIIIIRYYIYIPSNDFFIFYNILIAVINLIPSLPLDMARAIMCLFMIKNTYDKALTYTINISLITITILFLLGTYVLILGSTNILLFLLSFFFLSSVKNEKDKYLYNTLRKKIS